MNLVTTYNLFLKKTKFTSVDILSQKINQKICFERMLGTGGDTKLLSLHAIHGRNASNKKKDSLFVVHYLSNKLKLNAVFQIEAETRLVL